jgi:hypothetical protein
MVAQTGEHVGHAQRVIIMCVDRALTRHVQNLNLSSFIIVPSVSIFVRTPCATSTTLFNV